MKELHMKLLVEKSTTTRLLNPHIKRGFLERHKAEHDSRAALLVLTETGREALAEITSFMDRCFQELEKNIPERKRHNIAKNVKIFTRALRNLAQSASQGKKGGRCC